MKQAKVNVYEVEGYAVTVNMEECSLNEYAKNFLHIFNNVRESKELLKIKNHYGSNDITVYCEVDYKDSLVKYLKSFGEIKYCEKVLMLQVEEPDYDIDKYDDIIIVPDFD